MITLNVFPKWYLILTMTLHILHGRWRIIVYPPSSVFLNRHKGCIQRSTWPAASLNLYSVVQQVTSGKLDTWKFPRVYLMLSPAPSYQPISALILRVRHSPQWLEVKVCAYMSSYYWLICVTVGCQEGKRQRKL